MGFGQASELTVCSFPGAERWRGGVCLDNPWGQQEPVALGAPGKLSVVSQRPREEQSKVVRGRVRLGGG